jgi:hypothetical protein
MYSRCTASSGDLDGHRCLRRSSSHTEMLNCEFELGTLWDEYGIVGDVIVYNIYFHVHTLYLFMVFFSAIHKRISPSRYS